MERLAAVPPDGEWSRLLLTRRASGGPISLSPHKEMGERKAAQGKTLPYGFSLENPFPQSAKGAATPLDPHGGADRKC